MNMRQVQSIARQRAIKPGKLRKTELIRLIQRQEGNFDCFERGTGDYCDQLGCLWREDCLKGSKIPGPDQAT